RRDGEQPAVSGQHRQQAAPPRRPTRAGCRSRGRATGTGHRTEASGKTGRGQGRAGPEDGRGHRKLQDGKERTFRTAPEPGSSRATEEGAPRRGEGREGLKVVATGHNFLGSEHLE